MRLITASEVNQYLSMSECVKVIREAVAQLSRGELVTPDRAQLDVGAGISLIMPAIWPARQALTTKLISVFPDNPQQALPTTFALLAFVDTNTGQPLMLCEGSSLTALRTGALSGVATDVLARSDVETLTICGAGRHARTQLAANLCVRDFQRVLVVSRSNESAQQFVHEQQQRHPEIEFVAGMEPQDAIGSADVISCATTAHQPIFSGEWVTPGTHVNAIGAFTPTTRELDSDLIAKAQLVMDTKDGCWEEAGDYLIPLQEGRITSDQLQVELGRVVSGDAQVRTSADQITVFKSVGCAAFDVAAACALWQSLPRDVGTEVELDR